MKRAHVFAVWLAFACGCGDDGDGSSSAGGNDGGPSGPSAQAGAGGGAGRSPDAGDGGSAACDAPDGFYEALYTPLSGNCGPLADPLRVAFAAAAGGVSTNVRRLPSFDVTTEVVLQGCAARVIQTVTAQGQVVLRIAAELTVLADGTLSGDATVTRFENGAVACTGMYAVELRRASGTIGGNLGEAGSGPDAGGGELDGGLPADVQPKVAYDCMQTVQCEVQRGSEVVADPIAACIDNTTAFLIANPDRLDAYLETVAACEALVVCDYVECTASQR